MKQKGTNFKRGVKLGVRGKYIEAIAELSQAVEQDPNFVAGHVSLGVVFHRLENDDDALASYDRALGVDSKHAEAHYFRANIFYPKKIFHRVSQATQSQLDYNLL